MSAGLSMQCCDLTERFRQTRWTTWSGIAPSLLVLVLSAALSGPVAAIAQTCRDDNPAHAAALIDQIRLSCQRYDTPYSSDIYGLAAVADRQAIPALRRLAAWPTNNGPGASCSFWVKGARIALAKMGDEQDRAELNRDEASFIGDDGALTALIEFLVAHAKDPAMYVDFGDYGSDYRDTLLYEIDLIRRRRLVPDLQFRDDLPEHLLVAPLACSPASSSNQG